MIFLRPRFFSRILPLVVITFLIVQAPLFSQEKTPVRVSGKVVDGATEEGIAFATVIEKKSKTGTVSDDDGSFSIVVRPNDTLLITAIGFAPFEYAVNASKGNEVEEIINLQSKTYELEEVGVYARKNYKEFKKEFIELNLPEEKKAYIPPSSKIYSGDLQPSATISGPFSMLYDKYSKRGKEMRKVSALKAFNEQKQVAVERFNRNFVIRTLGVDETEADSVLSHCNFSPEFISQSNDYDLVKALKDCYISYKQP